MIAWQPGECGWIIADDELPGEVLSFVKADKDHYKGVKVRAVAKWHMLLLRSATCWASESSSACCTMQGLLG